MSANAINVADVSRELYILGHPVAHSKSPVMYNALYAKLGLPWHYDFYDAPDAQAADAFLAARDFLSINITTPYKPNAYAAADTLAASAKLAHGVNLLVCADANQGVKDAEGTRGDAAKGERGVLLGFNVDGDGAVRYLERAGVRMAGKRVVICGTGPTAVSIMHSCVQAGAAYVCLLGRDKERAHARIDAYLDDYRNLLAGAIALPSPYDGWLGFSEAYDNAEFAYGAYETSRQAIAAADIVVDATPLGMKAGDPTPFDPQIFGISVEQVEKVVATKNGEGGAAVQGDVVACMNNSADGKVFFDTVYGHGLTSFCALGRMSGARVIDGGGMLVSQAALTAAIVCEVEGVQAEFGYDEAFETMAQAAGFDVV